MVTIIGGNIGVLGSRLMDELAGHPPFSLTAGITAGTAAALAMWLAVGLIDKSPKTRNPRTIIRDDAICEIVFGLAIGLTNWLAAGLLRGPSATFPIVLLFWLTAWLAMGVWARYHVAVVVNAIRGQGPLRLGKFLDWGVEAGLLRVSGLAYQFRHQQLQDLLTAAEGDTSPATPK